jgi:hypothetical protein
MSGVEQHVKGTIRELQQVDRWIGSLPVQFRGDVDNDVPEQLLRRRAAGPAAPGQAAQVRSGTGPDLRQVDEGPVDAGDDGSCSRAMIVLPARSAHIVQVPLLETLLSEGSQPARTHPHNTLVAIHSHRLDASRTPARIAA